MAGRVTTFAPILMHKVNKAYQRKIVRFVALTIVPTCKDVNRSFLQFICFRSCVFQHTSFKTNYFGIFPLLNSPSTISVQTGGCKLSNLAMEKKTLTNTSGTQFTLVI